MGHQPGQPPAVRRQENEKFLILKCSIEALGQQHYLYPQEGTGAIAAGLARDIRANGAQILTIIPP